MANDDLRQGLESRELRDVALLLTAVAACTLAPALHLVLTQRELGPGAVVLLVVTVLLALAVAVCVVLAGQKASEARLRAELQYLAGRRVEGS